MKNINRDVEMSILGDLIKKYNLYDSKILEVGPGNGRIYQNEKHTKRNRNTLC